MIKDIFLPLLLLILLSYRAFSQSLPRQGATVPVIFVQELNSRRPSEPLIRIAEDLVDSNNKVIVRKGTPVLCEYSVKSAKRVGRPARITIHFISTQSIYGTTIPLTGTMTMEGEDRMAKVLDISLGLGLTVAPPMLFYLLKKGGEIIIPANAKSVIPRIAQNTFEQ